MFLTVMYSLHTLNILEGSYYMKLVELFSDSDRTRCDKHVYIAHSSSSL